MTFSKRKSATTNSLEKAREAKMKKHDDRNAEERHQEQIDEKNGQIEALETRNEELQREIDGKQRKLDILEEKNRLLEKKIDKFRNEVGFLFI
jgi:predicted RNase H-like nuclease (RuvC/YqgF family)